jgi:PAS domain S-box-containing protein
MLFVLLLTGGAILYIVNGSIQKKEIEKQKIRLEATHQDAVAIIENRIDNFSTLTAGIGSYIKHADTMPSATQLRNYVNHLVKQINYNDSIVVSFISPDHTFQYSFTKTQDDPKNLVGTSVKQFRSEEELRILETAMNHEEIIMFEPFNLVEGWSGVAMNFGVQRNGVPVGYVSPIINLSYILNAVYSDNTTRDFVFRFQTSKGHYFDRYAVYDGQPIHSTKSDPEYFKRAAQKNTRYIRSVINVYGYQLSIETGYKKTKDAFSAITYFMYIWFAVMAIFVVFTLWQMTRSIRLTKTLELARNELERLSIVASETENIILIMDAEGNVEWVNDSFVRLNKVTYEELIAERGRNIRTISNNENVSKIIDQAISTRTPVQYESLNITKTGERVWESSTLTPIFDEHGVLKKLIIIDSDVTERRDAEDQLKEKNKEILDSINYAKRLQEAILPTTSTMRKHLPNSFVLYKPKDIVAGDFYWMEEMDGYTYLAVADCTGHGVPGALVSVVCSNALHKATIEEELKEPGKILDRVAELVIDRFGKNDREVRDGMDIAFCRLNKNKTELAYAGAYNPLWIISSANTLTVDEMSSVSPVVNQNNKNLFEIKANKQPIGWHENRTEFQTHYITITPGSSIYLFSDGYADQFGGVKGKKFKTANLKKLFLKLHNQQSDEQCKLLNETFENWRRQFEQVDDVCIVGIQV